MKIEKIDRRSILAISLACSASACATGNVENSASPRSITYTCSELEQSGYMELYSSKDFYSPGSIEKALPPPVQALRCMTENQNASDRLHDLQQRGSLAGQLYAMIGLAVLDPAAFKNISANYLHRADQILLTGGDIVTYISVSEIIRGIADGFFVPQFLPDFSDRLPKKGVEFESPR